MPNYDYVCQSCGHRFEIFQSMNDAKLQDCPVEGCAGQVKRLLGTGAEAEEAGFAWYLHVGNVLFNVGLSLVLGLGYNHWRGAIVNFAVGTVIGEANILSAPAHLISGWKRYQKGGPKEAVSVHVIPTAGPGIGVLMTF